MLGHVTMSGDHDVIPGFQKRVLVDPERLRRLEQVYKERLTDNSQVTKAARLAAREAALLMAEDIPPAMKEALVKPLSREVRKWTKAVRRPVGFGGGPGGGAGGAEEDEDVEGEAFTQGPLQTLLTQLVKKKKRPAAAAEAEPLATPAAAGPPPKAKKRLRFVTPKKKTPVPKKKAKKKKATPKTMTPLVEWGELPFGGDPMLGESVAEMMEGTARSAKRKARKNRGRRPTETDKLQRPPGWLDFDTKLRRRLDGQDF